MTNEARTPQEILAQTIISSEFLEKLDPEGLNLLKDTTGKKIEELSSTTNRSVDQDAILEGLKKDLKMIKEAIAEKTK